jgi:hypothetical protein
MLQDEKYGVWSLSPAGYIQDTTEDLAVQLITDSPGYANYIFFYADLLPPVEVVEET